MAIRRPRTNRRARWSGLGRWTGSAVRTCASPIDPAVELRPLRPGQHVEAEPEVVLIRGAWERLTPPPLGRRGSGQVRALPASPATLDPAPGTARLVRGVRYDPWIRFV